MWHVYIIKCSDGSYYTGITRNLQQRIKRHQEGNGASYTRIRRPIELRYAETFADQLRAKQREVEIKDFSVKNKERLIQYGSGKRFPSSQNSN